MDKKQTATLLTFLRSSYPNHAEALAKPETAEIWHRALADIDYEVAQLAITKWVMTEKWPPTIADIREASVGVVNKEIKDWSEAWADVNREVRLRGPYREDEAMANLDEITRETVKRIGFQTLCETEYDEKDIMRAHFRDIYGQIADRHKADAQMPIALKERINAMQIGIPKNERIRSPEEIAEHEEAMRRKQKFLRSQGIIE